MIGFHTFLLSFFASTLLFALKWGLIAGIAGVFALVLLIICRTGWNQVPKIAQQVISFGLKLLFVAGLFVFLFRPETFGFPYDLFDDMTPGSLFAVLKDIEVGDAFFWLGFAATIKIAGIFAGIVRWRILLRAQGVHIPFWYLTKCWFWGRAIGLFLPGTLGLDAYRLVESARYTGEVIKCTTVIAVEKLTGFIALFTLVFLTIPLGARIFNFNPIMLLIVLGILAGFIGVTLLLLLQPRIIQILAAVLPLPGGVRDKINKIGAAVTAYSHRRGALFAALFFGLCVHVGICLMYFGTATAIRAENVDIMDILFASPLIIVGSVFAPTVSGMGVREVVMTYVLGAQAGEEKAFLFGHLGLWFGEIVPFILSLPLLLLTTRPDKDALMHEADAVRAANAHADETVHLEQEELNFYRNKVFGTIFAAIFGGLFAGAMLGIIESTWVFNLGGLKDAVLYSWSASAYGYIFACVGLGVAGALLFVYLLFNKFAPWFVSLALGFGGAFMAGSAILGVYRLRRDVFQDNMPPVGELIKLFAMAGGIALVCMAVLIAGAIVLRGITRNRFVPLMMGGALTFMALVGVAAAIGSARTPLPEPPAAFTPAQASNGPNIFLVAIDTLRADYVPVFNPNAEAETPNFQAFADDAIVYDKAFSQASWTKASFGTIFSGMFPECHTAVTKVAALPEDVETIAEALRDGGYYTQGYSNNPNITGVFGYGQGYVNYVDLKPEHVFGGTESVSKLGMYEVLRRVREKVSDKINLPINIEEYYQPGEQVTATMLDWIDGDAVPEDTPFFLFTHYMDPHDPYGAPGAEEGGYGRKRMGDNPDPEIYVEKFQAAYNAEIEYLDVQLGAFFQGLKDRGLYDDALIIITADHGEEFCEHGGWWHGQTLYDEQTHIPMMIKLPGNARGGERNVFLARNLDLAPTMLHFAGLEKGEMMQGQSLFDAENRDTNSTIAYAYAENNFEGIVLQAVRSTDGKKVIKANEGNKRDLKPVELYDTANDTLEQNDLSEDAAWATTEQDLLDIVDTYLTICDEGAIEASGPAEISQELQDQLDSLGYLE